MLGGCIYGACEDTKITGNFTNGTLAGCVFGACKNVEITGQNSESTPNTGTLIVTKVISDPRGDCPSCSPGSFTIKVTGNNPSLASFPGSATGTEVTLGPSKYTVSENPVSKALTFSGDCMNNGDRTASGNIIAGGTQKCTITNIISQ